MTVVAPGKAAEEQTALLIDDPQTGNVGIQIIQGDLKGFVVLVDRASLDAVSRGSPRDPGRIPATSACDCFSTLPT